MKTLKILGWTFLFLAILAIILAEGKSTIKTEILILRPQAEVYTFATTPGNWPLWHPSSLEVKGATNHSLEIGEKVKEAFLVAGREGSVEWTVIEKEAPYLWAIQGDIEGGAGSGGIITYQLVSQPEGTLFKRTFDYQITSFFYQLMNRLVFKRRITQESQKALTQLKEVLEAY